MPTFDLRSISAEQTHPLRNLVLRPGKPVSACRWPGDDDPASIHTGAFLDGALVAIASVVPEVMPEVESDPASETGREAADPARTFRLRGMATHPSYRGQGLGTALLSECIKRVRDAGGVRLWCNARTPAVAFYRRAGFTTVGEEFETPDIGPHMRMQLDLSGDPAGLPNT